MINILPCLIKNKNICVRKELKIVHDNSITGSVPQYILFISFRDPERQGSVWISQRTYVVIIIKFRHIILETGSVCYCLGHISLWLVLFVQRLELIYQEENSIRIPTVNYSKHISEQYLAWPWTKWAINYASLYRYEINTHVACCTLCVCGMGR